MRSLPSSVNVRRVGQVGVDAGLLALAYYLAYALRFDESIPHRYQVLLGDTIWITVPSYGRPSVVKIFSSASSSAWAACPGTSESP